MIAFDPCYNACGRHQQIPQWPDSLKHIDARHRTVCLMSLSKAVKLAIASPARSSFTPGRVHRAYTPARLQHRTPMSQTAVTLLLRDARTWVVYTQLPPGAGIRACIALAISRTGRERIATLSSCHVYTWHRGACSVYLQHRPESYVVPEHSLGGLSCPCATPNAFQCKLLPPVQD